MISSALENLVSSVQSNALLSDCITVCLSTAFSDLVAQNTEEGQKMLAGENSEKGTSKHVNCFSFLSQAHTPLLHMRMFVCLYVCMCAYVYIYMYVSVATFGIPNDLARLKRFFIFGFFDGAVGKREYAYSDDVAWNYVWKERYILISLFVD